MQEPTKRQSALDAARTGFLAAVFGGTTEGPATAAEHPAGGGTPAGSADGPDVRVGVPPGRQAGGAPPVPADELTRHRTSTVRAEQQRLAELLDRLAQPVNAMDFESQRRSYEPRPYPDQAPAEQREPVWADFAPPQPEEGEGRRLLDSGYQRGLAEARLAYQRALRRWRTERAAPADPAETAARAAHEQAEQARARAVREYNDSLEECHRAYRQAEPAAVESLLERALAAAEASTPELPAPCRAVFRPLTRTAVLDLDLPPLGLVPSLDGYRLSPDGTIHPVPRAPADRATDYLRLVSRLALRALQAVEAVDTDGILAGVVLNGWLRESGPGAASGRPPGDCLLSVDADRDALARTRLVEAAVLVEEETEPGVYAAAEQDEALVRLRDLAAAITPDPFARVAVPPCATAGAAVPAVGELSAGEFALLVREVLTRGGLGDWSVRARGRSGLVATGTGPADSALPGRWVVCASRRDEPIDPDGLRMLAEAVAEEAAGHGLWLSTGGFTEEALDLVETPDYRHLHLADGPGFRAMAETHLGLPLAVTGV
ncbi:restriction endonuclease [Kitasatospora viridis]|uniref:Restriction system protein n=1 Tax=Kitasatospora viridis TaxID=281105 RepID=A0A561UE92_9ACTN|nr:restriction endonuclease [Kitasatospora viridis]TWF97692.1 restriction system protein [Kitasatospora viridis]